MTPHLLAQAPVIPDFGTGSACETENRSFCWGWVQDHWGDTLQPALLQHLKLAVIAVVIGFVIAFASALVARQYRKLDQPIGLFTDFLYTIPSLALFQLLVPLTGITVTTVEIALVAYTLLILYRNILEGFRAVPEEVQEAARGMGLTKVQTLVRVELRSRRRRSSPACGSRPSRRSRSRRSPPSSSRRGLATRSTSGSSKTSSRPRSSPPVD
jgi:osmoprotectant transport system permease protein